MDVPYSATSHFRYFGLVWLCLVVVLSNEFGIVVPRPPFLSLANGSNALVLAVPGMTEDDAASPPLSPLSPLAP
jgi:hypothetical protein